MKKCVFAVFLLLLLCGCQKTKPEYIISSIGFDSKNGNFETCFEAIVLNSEKDEQELKILSGSGKTVEQSISKIKRQCTQPLLLSHCAAVAVGESVSEKQLNQIYDYCYNQREITLSAVFVKTENAKKLLSRKPVSTVCVGYDVLGLLEQYSEFKKVNFKNRYFEIMALRADVVLPKIALTKEGYYFENY